MKPSDLTRQENQLFADLEKRRGDRTFADKLYRDGVPSPEIYLKQKVKVVFVFREPNMPKRRPHDMRAEVRDERFRPAGPDGLLQERGPSCFWNAKAGLFAHAVSAALAGQPWPDAYRRFGRVEWHHDVVNRYAYIQIKKVGGAGTANRREIKAHAEKYADVLAAQIKLCQPHLVLGCGVGSDSPAKLLATHVLPGGTLRETRETGAKWWQCDARSGPRALVQLWHPARRGPRKETYQDVWASVREVFDTFGLRK